MTVRSNLQGIDIGLGTFLNCRGEVIRFMVELLLLQVGTCALPFSSLCFAYPTLAEVNMPTPSDHSPDQQLIHPSSPDAVPFDGYHASMFRSPSPLTGNELRVRFTEACDAWLAKSPSLDTRINYGRDLRQFLRFLGIPPTDLEKLAAVMPRQVAAWRDHLRERGLTNSSIRRKMTVLRAMYSYLRNYGYAGANPAHSDFVEAPAVPRDGKTVALTPEDCRRLLDAPSGHVPVGVRDRAMLAVLAYTGCRVGELCRLRVGDYKASGVHRILEIRGKGGKERRVPLHPEAIERLEAWLDTAHLRAEGATALFRPSRTARGQGCDGFQPRFFTRRAVQLLVARYVLALQLDPAVTVHSLRVTALTTARERGCDIVDLQIFAGHADPRTTLTYIRNRDRLSKSPAYVLRY